MIEEIEPDFIIPNNFSTEGLRQYLAGSAQGAMIFDEFKDMMALFNKRYNDDAKGFIMESYECPDRLTLGLRAKPRDDKHKKTTDELADESIKPKKEKFWIEKPFLNLASATTIEWFRESLNAPDIPGGFIPRFFIVKSYPKTKVVAWQKRDDPVKRERLIELLKEFQSLDGEIQVSKEAVKYYEDWYTAFDAKRRDDTSLISPFYSRLADEYTKKFSMLNCVDRTHALTIEKKDMAEACAFCENCVEELSDTLKDLDATYYSKDRRKVEDFLKSFNGAGKASREDICRGTRIRAKVLDEIFRDLEDSGLVSMEKVETGHTSGPKSAMYYTWKR